MALALLTLEGPRNYASAVGSDPQHKLAFWRMYLGMTRLACSQYTQHYSQGAACGEVATHYCSHTATCLLLLTIH